jgi:hypothetical protein
MIRSKMVGLVIGLLSLLVLTGCATMREYREETAKWQGLADRATGALGAGSVHCPRDRGPEGHV